MFRIVVTLFSLRVATGVGDPTCWTDGVHPSQCCDPRFGPRGNQACFDAVYTFERCCGTSDPALLAAASVSSWNSDCIENNAVLRHDGAHALFADVTTYGHKGCFMNNCKHTDKFEAKDRAICARLCSELPDCTHWSFGPQDNLLKCFLRKSDGGRQQASGWFSGAKACAPPPIPPHFASLRIADSAQLKECDKGKSETCPDVLAAVNTWKLAMTYLKKAIQHGVDKETIKQCHQIAAESANIASQITGEYRPSDNPPDFPRTVYNNRLVIGSLREWLVMHPKTEFNAADASLPGPLRDGRLCGRHTCFET